MNWLFRHEWPFTLSKEANSARRKFPVLLRPRLAGRVHSSVRAPRSFSVCSGSVVHVREPGPKNGNLKLWGIIS
jgi:hypothetical protein